MLFFLPLTTSKEEVETERYPYNDANGNQFKQRLKSLNLVGSFINLDFFFIIRFWFTNFSSIKAHQTTLFLWWEHNIFFKASPFGYTKGTNIFPNFIFFFFNYRPNILVSCPRYFFLDALLIGTVISWNTGLNFLVRNMLFCKKKKKDIFYRSILINCFPFLDFFAVYEWGYNTMYSILFCAVKSYTWDNIGKKN